MSVPCRFIGRISPARKYGKRDNLLQGTFGCCLPILVEPRARKSTGPSSKRRSGGTVVALGLLALLVAKEERSVLTQFAARVGRPGPEHCEGKPLPPFSSKLTEEAPVVGPHPLGGFWAQR